MTKGGTTGIYRASAGLHVYYVGGAGGAADQLGRAVNLHGLPVGCAGALALVLLQCPGAMLQAREMVAMGGQQQLTEHVG